MTKKAINKMLIPSQYSFTIFSKLMSWNLELLKQMKRVIAFEYYRIVCERGSILSLQSSGLLSGLDLLCPLLSTH